MKQCDKGSSFVLVIFKIIIIGTNTYPICGAKRFGLIYVAGLSPLLSTIKEGNCEHMVLTDLHIMGDTKKTHQ